MGKLYIVPTPIGNLEDITFRAISTLKEVDLILAEDTRRSSILMRHYGITTPLISHHQHNEHRSLNKIVERLQRGEKIALVTDAGTPGISDPGFLLVRECRKESIEVETLPGATALIPALVNSGLPSDRFLFEGFLPIKKGREKRLKALSEEERTIIFYESPFRLVKTLEQLTKEFGEERQASVSRELTKIYEENLRGSLSELLEHYSSLDEVKGEIVIVVAGRGRG